MTLKSNKPHVLVIGSETAHSQYYQNQLSIAGYEAVIQTAAQVISDPTILFIHTDCIIFTIPKPAIEDYILCQNITQDSQLKDIPVAFITSENEEASIIKAFEAGATDYIIEPVNREIFLRKINVFIRLKQQNDLIQKSESQIYARNKFISIIAHDLKNPFTGISMLSQNLTMNSISLSDEKKQEYASIIKQTANEGLHLLESLLQWSGSQTGKLKYMPKQILLRQLIEEGIKEVEKRAIEKHIHIEIHESPEILVFADAKLFQTILTNILSNAIKYSFPDSKIVIGAVKEDDFIEISITDKGTGMTQDILKKLFKIESNITSEPGTFKETGIGFGLIICAEFIEKMGGNIWAKSKQGEGSTFYFTIPIGSE